MKHTKNIALALIVVFILLGGLMLIARPKSETPQVATAVGTLADLKAGEDTFDFGSVSMAAGKVSHTFKVKNEGADPVVVTKMFTSCMCTSASITTKEGKMGPFGMPGHGFIPEINRVIAPGEEAAVEVVFDPAAHGPAGVGRIERVVTLESGDSEPLKLGFGATVTP